MATECLSEIFSTKRSFHRIYRSSRTDSPITKLSNNLTTPLTSRARILSVSGSHVPTRGFQVQLDALVQAFSLHLAAFNLQPIPGSDKMRSRARSGAGFCIAPETEPGLPPALPDIALARLRRSADSSCRGNPFLSEHLQD